MIITLGNWDKVADQLSLAHVLSLDSETTGLALFDRLFSVIISDDKDDFYFDKRIIGPSFIPRFKYLIASLKCTWVLKNAKFDMHMLEKEGIYLPNAEDITIAARLLRNDFYGEKAYSLAELAKREGMAKSDLAMKHIKENKLYEVRKPKFGKEYKQPQFDKIPQILISEYACKDARLTYDLRRIYLERMDASDKKVYAMETELLPVCLAMERQGIRLDIAAAEAGHKWEKECLATKKRHFTQATGIEYSDSKTVLLPIFKEAGELEHFTKAGNPSLTDEILDTFTSPIAKIVQSVRHHEKRISTYYENYLNMVDDNSRIHPTMWQEGTRTGRFSYSNPNLQNIPKEEGATYEHVVRACFIPSPGNYFISLDFKQMEYRLMLAYANAKRLIKQVCSRLVYVRPIHNLLN